MSKYIVLSGTDDTVIGQTNNLMEALSIQGCKEGNFERRIYKQIEVTVTEATPVGGDQEGGV